MISVNYFTLKGLEDKLNEIDQEDQTSQYTSILSLVILPATGDNDPTAVVVTKTELVPEYVKEALAAQAAADAEADDTDVDESKAPEFFAAPEAAEADESV